MGMNVVKGSAGGAATGAGIGAVGGPWGALIGGVVGGVGGGVLSGIEGEPAAPKTPDAPAPVGDVADAISRQNAFAQVRKRAAGGAGLGGLFGSPLGSPSIMKGVPYAGTPLPNMTPGGK